MLFARRRQRLVAALLACASLAAASARPLLACDAGRAEQHSQYASPHEAHSTHQAPQSRGPHAPACDHVVGCAVIAIVAAPSVLVLHANVSAAPTRAFVSLIDAPVRAIEPPPPRAQV